MNIFILNHFEDVLYKNFCTLLNTNQIMALNAIDNLIRIIDEKKEDSDIDSDGIKLGNALLSSVDFDENDKIAIKLLMDINQTFIFKKWSINNISNIDKKKLFKQIIQLNSEYPNGLKAYYLNGKQLLMNSFKGVNPYDGWIPNIPSGVRLNFGTKEYFEYEMLGKKEFPFVGFVLVAGGLGERLGYSSIKIELPIEISTELKYIAYYIYTIREMEKIGKELTKKDIILPMAIMTSDQTHNKTLKLLKDNNYFGMKQEQITLMKQNLVPTFSNNKCEFGMNNDYTQILLKPHGHGDVHNLIYKHDVANKWYSKYGTKWITFIQDTNAFSMKSVVPSLGVCAKYNFAMNSITVPRKPGQALGGIAKLVNSKTDEVLTINVEYNQLGPMLLSTGDKKGDIPDDSGYSKYPGNVNTFIIKTDLYVKVLNETKGVIPEFVNPKYKTDKKLEFKKPTRLECMMQEYPKLIVKYKNESCGITQLPVWLASQPVKSNIVDSIKQYSKIKTCFSASHGERAFYQYFVNILSSKKNIKIETDNGTNKYANLPVNRGPNIVFYPNFGVTVPDILSKFDDNGSINISKNSTLIIKGKNILIKNLNLDGCLILDAWGNGKIIINNLTVKNNGYSFKEINVNDNNVKEIYRIRGYILNNTQQKIIKVEPNKEIIIDDTK